MLIRSQDKEQLLNIDSVKTIGICERGKCFAIFIDSLYFIGNYSRACLKNILNCLF